MRIDSIASSVPLRAGAEHLVSYSGAEATIVEDLLEAVEYFSTHAETFAEAACTHRADHEFLEGDRSVRVRATIDDVHHRYGQYIGVRATDVAIEGDVEVLSGSLSDGERYTEDSVSTEVALGLGAIESDPSSGRSHAGSGRSCRRAQVR